jgi:hypothetical protein
MEETGTEDASDNEDMDEDDEVPLRGKKRKARAEPPTRRLRPRKSATDDDTDTNGPVSTLGGSLRDMVMKTLEIHIQGMCDEVDVRIDNLRPREEQFHESDFLDSEPSGDEDWAGVDLDFEQLYPNGYRRGGKTRRVGGW